MYIWCAVPSLRQRQQPGRDAAVLQLGRQIVQRNERVQRQQRLQLAVQRADQADRVGAALHFGLDAHRKLRRLLRHDRSPCRDSPSGSRRASSALPRSGAVASTGTLCRPRRGAVPAARPERSSALRAARMRRRHGVLPGREVGGLVVAFGVRRRPGAVGGARDQLRRPDLGQRRRVGAAEQRRAASPPCARRPERSAARSWSVADRCMLAIGRSS